MILQFLYTAMDGIVVGNFAGEQALGAMNTSAVPTCCMPSPQR